MRFLIAEFKHESNCFSSTPTGLEDFRRAQLASGQSAVDAHVGKRTVLGGFLDAIRGDGDDAVPIIAASALPSGPVQRTVYDYVKGQLLRGVKNAHPIAGILLSLHGAMSIENAEVEDPEGDIVSSIRTAAGDSVPIGVVLDPHSDVTDLLLEGADVTLAYNEEPHRDAYDRGAEAVRLVRLIRDGSVRPTSARARAPMLLPAINMATDRGPMHELHRMREEFEQLPGVLDLSIHGGFYGSYQPEAGFGVVCTTDQDPPLAARLAKHLAREAWIRRERFLVTLVAPKEAVHAALAAHEPIALIDEADDPSGGGAADSVVVLREMIAAGVVRGGVSTIKDAEVAREMAKAGVGRVLTARLGGKTDSRHGEPIAVTGRVLKLHEGPVPADSWSRQMYRPGIVGVLDVKGILVIVTEHKLVTENIDIFHVLGFDVRTMQAVGFKGLGLHIRQALSAKISRFIHIDGVGVTHPDVRKLGAFRRICRPVWPLDDLPPGACPARG